MSVPNLKNELVNVCLGFQEPEAYLSADEKYFGAIVGRYCNRIANASFELEGKTYQLAKNSDNHHLHGGLKAFHTVLWNIELITENAVKFSYYSPDGEEGFETTHSSRPPKGGRRCASPKKDRRQPIT